MQRPQQPIEVLLVDDELDRMHTKEMLVLADPTLEIKTVQNPINAITEIKEGDFDCIISDYQMPEMNGLQLCREIRRFSSIPFIIYTGRESDEIAYEALKAGVDDYVRKEKELAHYQILAKRIRQAVEKHAEKELGKNKLKFKTMFDKKTISTSRGLTRDISLLFGKEMWSGVFILTILSMLLVYFVNPSLSLDYAPMRYILTTGLIFIPSITVAFISAKAYLKQGLIEVLLLGCGVLMFGLTNLATVFLTGSNYTNTSASVFMLGSFMAASLHLFSAINLTFSKNPHKNMGISAVLGGYSLVLGFIIITTLLAIRDLTPLFIDSYGRTLLATWTTLISGGFYVVSSGLITRMNSRKNSEVLFWYSLGLATIAVGTYSRLLSMPPDSVFAWLGRFSYYLGGAYFLASSLSASEGWDRAFNFDRIQFDLLFSKMSDSFAYYKALIENDRVDYVFLLINDSFENQTGLKRADIIGKRITEIIPGIEKNPIDWMSLYNGVLFEGDEVRFECFIENLNRWYSLYAYSPEPGYLATLSEDITKRKFAEDGIKRSNETLLVKNTELEAIEEELLTSNEELIRLNTIIQNYASQLERKVESGTSKLRESEEALSSFLDSSTDNFMIFDKDFRLIDLNQSAFEMFSEIAQDNVIGKDIKGLFTDIEPERFKGYNSVMQTGIPYKSGSYLKIIDGERRWFNTVAFRVGDGVGLRISNITEQKQNEDRLRLAEQFEAVSSIGATIAHDLRNPLSRVTQSIELALKRPERADRMLDIAYENAMYALNMVEEFRLGTRKIIADKKAVNLEEFIKESINSVKLPDKVKLALLNSNDLESVIIDPEIIKRVIDNLTMNAIEAMPDGGVLTISTQKVNDMAVIEISDTGVGIKPEQIKHIWQPMFTTKSKGIGLGLYFVRSAVEAHGGQVDFKSKPGVGTSFIIKLPL